MIDCILNISVDKWLDVSMWAIGSLVIFVSILFKVYFRVQSRLEKNVSLTCQNAEKIEILFRKNKELSNDIGSQNSYYNEKLSSINQIISETKITAKYFSDSLGDMANRFEKSNDIAREAIKDLNNKINQKQDKR
jgi:hypothetical protein